MQMFLSGDEALARGAWEAGLTVACAYPGTPSTEILETLSRCPEIDTQWSVNEKVAFEVALGASIAGARSLYASKHVGINVAMDPLMTSAYTGVTGGFIVVTADDPGLHSSQNEQDNRLVAQFAKLPLLEPSTPREAYAFAKEALALSETFDTPVLMRLTTRIAHTKENVAVGARVERPLPPFAVNPQKYVMVPGNAYRRHSELEKRLIALTVFSETTPMNRIEMNDPRRGFVTSGVSYLYAKEMYPDASFLKLGFSYPMPDIMIRQFAAQVKELVVLEELEPFIEDHVRALGIPLKAKHYSFRVGELRPELLPAVVDGHEKTEEASTARKPVMCPGCPHRPVFRVLKKLKAVVAGDIGCYTLGALPPLAALHTCVCMGGGVTLFEGMWRVLKKGVVGVIGDSTFVHSGVTGLINASYNNAKGVLLILDNGTTAMTGSQPNPATGVTIAGAPTKQLKLDALCAACGADTVDVVNPNEHAHLEALLRQRMGEDTLSVIIARFPCQIIERNRFEPPAFIAEKCVKCYQCLVVNCPAIAKTDDGFVAVDHTLCAGCKSCAQQCPTGALK